MASNNDLPPLDADPDEWDDKWFEKTTITVDRHVKAALDHDRDGKPWNEYLESLRRQKADPLTLNEVDEVAAHILAELDLTSDVAVDGEAIADAVTRRFDYAAVADKAAEQVVRELQR